MVTLFALIVIVFCLSPFLVLIANSNSNYDNHIHGNIIYFDRSEEPSAEDFEKLDEFLIAISKADSNAKKHSFEKDLA